MERGTVISNQQLMALIVISTVGTSSLYAPATLSHYAERDSWLLVMVGCAIGLLNLFVFLQLNKLHPDKNLIEICREVFGRWFGGLLAFAFICYLLDLTSWVLREFAQFFIIALNPMIPQNWYLIAGVIMCAYAVYHGLEVFARVSLIILAVTIATFLTIYVMLGNQYHPEYLLPVLENGLLQPLKGTVAVSSWFGDLMIVSMILKHVKRSKKTVRWAIAGVGITGCLLMLSVVGCTIVFGGKTTSTFTYPSISLIQNIKLFRNIERLDAALIVVWVMSCFIKITVYFWSALKGMTDWLKLSRPRLFIVPMAASLVVCSKYKVWGLIELASFYDKQAWYFVLFQLLLPSLLLGAAWVKQKANNREEGQYGTG
ncbi:endospore germination permease [Paenibacillus hodogayensis]|uniref:Endospore germination permease n=1 Tax=Paenibacillus hodogayensis TaxID=279208 RepID=A0ABV5W548_9BACL